MAEEVILRLQADISEVKNALAEIKTGVNETKEATSQMQGQLDKATGGMVSGFKAGVAGIKNAVTGMKTLRGAIMATGIGALVVAFASLTAYFSKTERGAEQLRVITAVLGAVLDSLMDVVIHLGEALFKAFTNPKQALKDLGDSIKYYFMEFIPNAINNVLDGFGKLGKAISLLFKGEFEEAGKVAVDGFKQMHDGITDLIPATAILKAVAAEVGNIASAAINAAEAANALERALNGVIRKERELIVDRAKANRQVAELRLIAQDQTKSLNERVEALKEAAAIEQSILDRELAVQSERLRIMEAKANLAESDSATLDAIAQQAARVEEMRTASFMKQREIVSQVAALTKQAQAQEEARLKAIIELEKERQLLALEQAEKQVDALNRIEQATLSAYDRDWQAAYDHYGDLILLAEQYGVDATELREKQLEATQAIEQKYRDAENAEKLKAAQVVEEGKQQMAEAGFSVLSQLTAKNAKAQKGVAVAQTIWNTAQAIMASIRTLGLPAGLPGAIATGAMGAVQIAKIMSSNPDSAGGSISMPSAAPTSAAAGSAANALQGSQRNQLNDILNQQNNMPLRAYVVSNEVTSQQGMDRRILQNATFG